MGLPINKLVVATNKNDILKRVITKGIYKPLKVEHTISPSMDIQVASNFERLLFDVCSCDSAKIIKSMNALQDLGEFKVEEKDIIKIQESFYAESLSDEETKSIIKKAYNDNGMLIDPHTAVAVGAANKIQLKGNVIILATAHPSKFSEVIFKETNIKAELPESLKDLLNHKEVYVQMPRDLKKLKSYILKKI